MNLVWARNSSRDMDMILCQNSPGQRPEGVQDPQDGSVATATVTFTCILSAGGGTPPRISSRALSRPGFSVSDYSRTRLALFPNSFFLIPELVPTSTHWISKNKVFPKEKTRFFETWPYSRTRLALFPNSFPLFPNSFGRGAIQVDEFGNKAKRVRVQE